MIEQLIQWDKELLITLNGSSSLFLDGIFMAITQTATWIPMFACLLYAVVKNNTWRQSLLVIAMVALLVTLCDQFASGFCKPYFHRLRPSREPELAAVIDLVNGYRCGLYGFISSHAANTFGISVFFSLLFRNRRITPLLLLYACLSSYSRMYLGVHYPLDILMGTIWGVFCGFLVYALYGWTTRKYPALAGELRQGAGRFVPLYWVFPLTIAFVLIRGIMFTASS